MHLSNDQINRTEKIRAAIIKNYVTAIEEKCRKCEVCGGTGLGNISKSNHSMDFSWDCQTFCDTCEGVGFVDWKDTPVLMKCDKCHGSGRDHDWVKCERCNGKGILDWVEFMKGHGT